MIRIIIQENRGKINQAPHSPDTGKSAVLSPRFSPSILQYPKRNNSYPVCFSRIPLGAVVAGLVDLDELVKAQPLQVCHIGVPVIHALLAQDELGQQLFRVSGQVAGDGRDGVQFLRGGRCQLGIGLVRQLILIIAVFIEEFFSKPVSG